MTEESSYKGHSNRVVSGKSGTIPYLALLPSGYAGTSRRYPVVYLMQGGLNDVDCYLGKTDLIAFTAKQRLARQAIVVMPDMASGPVWAGNDGVGAHEREFWRLIRSIEARFRTIPGRSHRAIAGFSAGGLGALSLAARHPDRFASVAGLSAVAELSELDPFALAIGEVGDAGSDANGDFNWGDPVIHPIGWHNVDPVSLATNFRGIAVDLFSGDDRPCDAQDVGFDPTINFWPPQFWLAEALVARYSLDLSIALHDASVSHRFELRCGVHSYRHVQEEIHKWWPRMFAAFGRPTPKGFNYYRLADRSFAVWGWSFRTDPRRAREFLEIGSASVYGLRLVGSGRVHITTAKLFGDTERVRVTSRNVAVYPVPTNTKTVTARAGRITFDLDLGPPHGQEQYTPQERALDALLPYWEEREIRFSPLGRGHH